MQIVKRKELSMNIEIDTQLYLALKEKFFISFLLDDLEILELVMEIKTNPDDVKENKKLIKAYNRILSYNAVDYDFE